MRPENVDEAKPHPGAARNAHLVSRWAAILVTVGATVRLGFWLLASQNPPLVIQGDGRGYEQIARNVMEGNGFSMRGEPPYWPDLLRTPGYPLFIAGVYSLAGTRPEMVTLYCAGLSAIRVLARIVPTWLPSRKPAGFSRQRLTHGRLPTGDVGRDSDRPPRSDTN